MSQEVLHVRRVLMQKVARELLTMPDGPASVEVILLAQQSFPCMSDPALACDGRVAMQVHLAGVETLRSEKDLLALFAARQNRMLGQLKQKMAAASVSGSQAKEVRQ